MPPCARIVVWCALVWASLPTLVAQNPCAIVRDLNQTPAPRSGRIEPRSLRAPGVEFGDDRMVAVGNALYFTAIDALHGQEVWCSDGTPGGTRLVVDINPGRSGSSPFRLQSVSLPAGPRLMFSAWDATGRSSVYLSDGTSAGTIRLAPTATTGVLLEAAATVGSRVVFGWGEPWVTDGTAASTRLLKEVMPGPGSSRASQFVAHPSGQFALFTATDGQHGIELWRTDGTPNGTVMVKDIVAGSGGSNPGGLVAHNGTVLFAVQNGLWRSDGTAAGTVQVAALSSVKLFAEAVVGNLLYFTASDTTVGTEVFQTDGTTAGTKVAVDLIPGRGGPLPRNLHGAGSKLYFTARPQGGSFQPFALQGTTLTPIGPMVGSPDKYTYIGGGGDVVHRQRCASRRRIVAERRDGCRHASCAGSSAGVGRGPADRVDRDAVGRGGADVCRRRSQREGAVVERRCGGHDGARARHQSAGRDRVGRESSLAECGGNFALPDGRSWPGGGRRAARAHRAGSVGFVGRSASGRAVE